jgi:putative transposase
VKGDGFILVFRLDTPNGGTEYWATSDLDMSMDLRATTAREAWAIETYHRDIKPFCGIERGMVRGERAQRNHSGWALRCYVRLIWHERKTGASRFTTKMNRIRPAIQPLLTAPSAVLAGFPQAGMAHKRATA